jgi:hypothetical protein
MISAQTTAPSQGLQRTDHNLNMRCLAHVPDLRTVARSRDASFGMPSLVERASPKMVKNLNEMVSSRNKLVLLVQQRAKTGFTRDLCSDICTIIVQLSPDYRTVIARTGRYDQSRDSRDQLHDYRCNWSYDRSRATNRAIGRRPESAIDQSIIR